mmetsp:Transcript_45826/g.109370  ORF Transcript_45826/g.109370 Transcript_45826/m.109370 type:complete len:287 (-) Transcript_45826:333-1193(-)
MSSSSSSSPRRARSCSRTCFSSRPAHSANRPVTGSDDEDRNDVESSTRLPRRKVASSRVPFAVIDARTPDCLSESASSARSHTPSCSCGLPIDPRSCIRARSPSLRNNSWRVRRWTQKSRWAPSTCPLSTCPTIPITMSCCCSLALMSSWHLSARNSPACTSMLWIVPAIAASPPCASALHKRSSHAASTSAPSPPERPSRRRQWRQSAETRRSHAAPSSPRSRAHTALTGGTVPARSHMARRVRRAWSAGSDSRMKNWKRRRSAANDATASGDGVGLVHVAARAP